MRPALAVTSMALAVLITVTIGLATAATALFTLITDILSKGL